MSKFVCEKCKKIFPQKSAYTSHLMRLNPCIKDDTIVNECEYCKKLYSTKYKLKNHLNICKKKQSIDDHNQSQIEELKKMFEKKFEEQQKHNQELEKKIEELTHLSHATETNNNNITVTENSNNTTNNITNNINIYSVGKEDLSLLSKKDIIRICTSGTYYPQVAAELIHCNKDYPEFQNILIPNLRSNTGLVKINDNWVSKSHEEIFRTLLKIDKNHVSTLIKNLEVDDKLKVKLESTQDEIDTNESKEHQKPKIKEALYNASRMIARNKKKEEKIIVN
jgi:hypothetical protein